MDDLVPVDEVTPMRIADELVVTDDVHAVTSPYDGREVGKVPVGTPEDIDRAVGAAVDVLAKGQMPAHLRAEVLDRAAQRLLDQQERFARLIAEEAGKPIRTARIEAARAVDTFRFSAAVARTLTGETVPLDASPTGTGKVGIVMRVPIGVVAAITPFNFPLNLVAHKVAPAIAAGCPVVVKPASATPLSALALANLLLDECGLPTGWLQVVTTSGAVADHLVTHPGVAMVSFTGSVPVGWSIREQAPRKKVSLELGNNSPVIVAEDGDWQSAAAGVSVGGYAYAGQSCIAVQRVYVHRSLVERFTEALVAEVEALTVGSPLDEATEVSVLIDAAATDRVSSLVADALAQGATLRTGGDLTSHGVLRPTVLGDVRPEMDVCRTEVFGPVVGIQAFDHLDEAIALANDTPYGLQAGMYTASLATAMRAARELDFGGVTINEVPTWRADQMPYGGVRDSGNTKEGPAWAAREMTQERMIIVQP